MQRMPELPRWSNTQRLWRQQRRLLRGLCSKHVQVCERDRGVLSLRFVSGWHLPVRVRVVE